jgi:hypothetical protein
MPQKTRRREPAVPELTRCANIKLNNGVSLQRRPERLVISRRTIFPPKVVRAHRQSRQANMPPLGGFVLKVAMMLIESREIDPGSSLQEPKAAWAGVWHLWTVILPRRSITGRLVFGKVWRRHDGRRWIYKKFIQRAEADRYG